MYLFQKRGHPLTTSHSQYSILSILSMEGLGVVGRKQHLRTKCTGQWLLAPENDTIYNGWNNKNRGAWWFYLHADQISLWLTGLILQSAGKLIGTIFTQKPKSLYCKDQNLFLSLLFSFLHLKQNYLSNKIEWSFSYSLSWPYFLLLLMRVICLVSAWLSAGLYIAGAFTMQDITRIIHIICYLVTWCSFSFHLLYCWTQAGDNECYTHMVDEWNSGQ